MSTRLSIARPVAWGLAGLCLGACPKQSASPPPADPVTPPLTAEVTDSTEAPVDESTQDDEPPPPPKLQVEGYDAVAEVLGRNMVGWSFGGEARLALSRRGPVRLTPDGIDHPPGVSYPFNPIRRVKVVDNSARPRIVVDEGGVRLLLYVDRADAHPIIVQQAPLRPKPNFTFSEPPKRGHAILEVGAWVNIETPGDREVEVTLYSDDPDKASWTGWVDAEALGTVAIPDRPKPDSETWYTQRTTPLRIKPGGKSLLVVDDGERVYTVSDRVTKGHRLVHYSPACWFDVSFVGFIKAKDLYQPTGGFGYGCGFGSIALKRHWGYADGLPRVSIEAGRFLLDIDQPIVVGCVLRSTELADAGDGTYAVATSWGPIPVRLAPAEFEGQCGLPLTRKNESKDKSKDEGSRSPGLARWMPMP